MNDSQQANPGDEPSDPVEDAPDDLVGWDHDQDIWEGGEAEEARHHQRVRTIQIVLGTIVVLVIGGVLIAKITHHTSDASAAHKRPPATSSGSSSTTTGSTKTGSTSAVPHWPASVNGRPLTLGTRGQTADKVAVKAAPGVYVWSDFDGWHLWVVGGSNIPAIAGTMTSNSEVAKAVPAVPGASVTKNGKVVSFVLPTGSPITGVDFNPGFFAHQVVITVNGPTGPLDAKVVRLGRKATQAPFPLVIEKS